MKTLHLAMLGNRAHCWKSLVCVPRCKRPLGHVGYKKPHLGIQTGELCHGFCNFPRPSWWKGRHSTSVDRLRGGLKRRSNRMFFLCHVSIDSVRLLSLLVQQKSQILQSFQVEKWCLHTSIGCIEYVFYSFSCTCCSSHPGFCCPDHQSGVATTTRPFAIRCSGHPVFFGLSMSPWSGGICPDFGSL